MQYISFLVIFILTVSFFFIFKRVLFRKAKKFINKNEAGKIAVEVVEKIKPAFYIFLSFYFALSILFIPDSIRRIIFSVLVVWIAYLSVIAAQRIIDFTANKYLLSGKEDRERSAIGTIVKFSKGLLWLFAGLVALSTMGVNITAIVAGMGIGGIAIAFALQNILNDLFSSFAIYFDKPFVEGDFIIVGEKTGVVEKIGVKTTRLRALQGEEIVISNRELTSVQIHNFKKMQRRRANFDFGVIYETSSKKLEKIPGIVEKIIEKEELADFDRAHFNKFGDFSLDFSVVYYIKSADFIDYMNTHQSILFKIKKEFEKETISMAFPTQTVYINKNNA